MATFSTIDAGKAPANVRPTAKGHESMAKYDAFLRAVKKGQVGKLRPAAGESPRGLMVRVRRAAKRVGKSVDVWTASDAVYFKIL